MKSTIKYLGGFLSAAIVLGGLASCQKMDYPDRFTATEGLPSVDYVRYAAQDVFISQAFMDEVLCVVGDNLRSVHDVLFNDQKAILNTSYITDHTLIVSVPSTPWRRPGSRLSKTSLKRAPTSSGQRPRTPTGPRL